MESEILCQWSNCRSLSDKHVVFGRRLFDPDSGIHQSDAPDTNEHRDLCERHVRVLRSQYLFVIVYKPGECPKCGNRTRMVNG